MDRQLSEWRQSVDRIWSAPVPDYHEAARLAEDIARATALAVLRQAASQALPILRSAAQASPDQSTIDAALRRLRVVREVLHTLTTPAFGKREVAAKVPTVDERYRQMLGLPLDRRLSAPEIHRAFKHAAKHAHPDAGGSAREFLELSTARDALVREVRLVRSV